MSARVRLVVDAHGLGTVHLDDLDLSHVVSTVTISTRPQQPAEVTLRLPAVLAAATVDHAPVRLDPDTWAALQALGWSPPPEAER
jgi:hypothetical protein